MEVVVLLCLAVAILARMYQVRIFESFLVWHVMWVASDVIYFTCLDIVRIFNKSCTAIYVDFTQFTQVLYGGFNVIFVVIRFFDPFMRRRLRFLIGLKYTESYKDKSVRSLDTDMENAEIDYRLMLINMDFSIRCDIFSSLRRKFILDALTAFNILFTHKHRVELCKSKIQFLVFSSRHFLLDQSTKESSIWFDGKTLHELFNDGLNCSQINIGGNSNAVRNQCFKVVEYLPEVFANIRETEGILLPDLVK